MNVPQVMAELEKMSSASCKHTLLNHGAREPILGVKIGDLKTIQKKIKKDHELSLELFRTGVSDAQYLAGLIADEKKIKKEDLQSWVKNANWMMISEYTVAWVAAESAWGWELALEWIDSDREMIQVSGWATLSSIVAIKEDNELQIDKIASLLRRVEKQIHKAANRTRYVMNNFVLSVGCYVEALLPEAQRTAKAMGKVSVDMGNTSCQVPDAPAYIQKVIAMGRVGKKKKKARC